MITNTSQIGRQNISWKLKQEKIHDRFKTPTTVITLKVNDLTILIKKTGTGRVD